MKEFITKLNEGFDLFYNNGTYYVEMTDRHEDGVDTSFINNPLTDTIDVQLYSRDDVIPIPVVSIFTRKNHPQNKFDGNPVLYALKNDRGYKFHSYKKDIKFIEIRFKEIFKKHFDLYGSNATVICPSHKRVMLPKVGVMVPTTSIVNEMIVRLIKECCPDMKFITDMLVKMTTDAVWSYSVETPNSYFYDYFVNNLKYNQDELDDVISEFESYLDIMDEKNNGKFKRHYIKNKDIRAAIVNTLQLSEVAKTYKKDINDRDILLIDDTLTYGQTIEECVNIIIDNYSPKSITVLTMFSQKQSYY